MTFSSYSQLILKEQEDEYAQTAYPELHGVAFKVGPVIRDNKLFQMIQMIGYKESVYTYFTNASPLTGSLGSGTFLIPYLPAVAETLKIASSSALDTLAGTRARQVAVVGLDDNYEVVFELVNLNGQTPVNTVNAFRRIGTVTVTQTGTPASYNASQNLGTIYTASNTATFTGGVPDDLNLCFDVMLPNRGHTTTDVLPVKAGDRFYPTSFTISSSINSNKVDSLIVQLRIRQGNSGWRTFTTFNVSTAQPVITVAQDGFQSGVLQGVPFDSDISMAVSRVGGAGTTDAITCSVFMSGFIVRDLV